jgi:NTP pyrophosphatase (non-canonical NTP hydrolase)
MTTATGRLEAMMNSQTQFMHVLGVPVAGEIPGDPIASDAVNEAAIGLSCEAAEVLADLRTRKRPWKTPATRDHVIEESIDCLFYLMEIWLILGVTPSDVEDVYQAKLTKNYDRIKTAK